MCGAYGDDRDPGQVCHRRVHGKTAWGIIGTAYRGGQSNGHNAAASCKLPPGPDGCVALLASTVGDAGKEAH